ncbi:hypothetical protein N7445_008882, partial [Penicillium cf. griseofulvum]
SIEVPTIYAIAAGGIFLALFLIQTRYILTRAGILVYISYIAVNIALVFLRTESLVDSGRRVGELALINIIFPLLAAYLNLSSNWLDSRCSTIILRYRRTLSSARLYVYITLSILGLIIFLELAIYLYRNGIFSGCSTPRALVLFLSKNILGESLPRIIADTLKLLVQPRKGFSIDLVRYSSLPIDSSVLFLALFTGPYRLTEDVDPYETTLIIATGFRIATSIPYIKKIIYSYNIYTSYTRRLHLGLPDYRKIISTEASRSQIKRLPNIPDKPGRTLVIVSASDGLRDRLRDIARGYLHQGVELSELEYQPE